MPFFESGGDFFACRGGTRRITTFRSVAASSVSAFTSAGTDTASYTPFVMNSSGATLTENGPCLDKRTKKQPEPSV